MPNLTSCVLLLLAFASLGSEEISPALASYQNLLAVRDDLQAQFRQRWQAQADREAASDLYLRLDSCLRFCWPARSPLLGQNERETDETLGLVLPRRGGVWQAPSIRLLSSFARREFSLQDCDTSRLSLSKGAITGKLDLTVAFGSRRNDPAWFSENMPWSDPDLPMKVNWMQNGVASIGKWDFGPRERLQPIRRSIAIDTHDEGQHWLWQGQMSGVFTYENKKPMDVTFLLWIEDGRVVQGWARVHGFNTALSRIDLSQWSISNGQLKAELTVILGNDKWVLTERVDRTLLVEADLSGGASGGRCTGRVQGTHTSSASSSASRPVLGTLTGTLYRAATGTWTCDTATYGKKNGRVWAALAPLPTQAPTLPELPKIDAKSASSAILDAGLECFRHIVGMDWQKRQPWLTLDEALVSAGDSDDDRFQWRFWFECVGYKMSRDPVRMQTLALQRCLAGTSAAEVAAHLNRLTRIAKAWVPEPAPLKAIVSGNDGPLGEPQTLPPGDRLPSGPEAGSWRMIGDWTCAGFINRCTAFESGPFLPEIALDPLPANTLTQSVRMDDDLPCWRWQTRPSAPDWAVAIPEDLAEALVSKIRFKSNKKSEIQQSFATWYASSKVVSERACSASLAVRLHSDGRVWVNDRLVWRSDRSVTPEVITSVPVDLVAGENRITVACSPFRGNMGENIGTYGRFGLGWFSLWIRAGVQTTSTVVTQDLRSIAPMKSTPANPPLAWDLRTGENVRWQINLPVEDAPPAVFQDRVFAALTTGELACLDRATGAVIWRQGPSIAAMAQPKPQTRMTDGSDGSTPEQVVIPPMTLAPVVDPQAVWLHDPERGRVACFGHDGRERWSVQVPPMTDRVQRGWFDGRTFDPRQTPVLADGRLYISSGPIEAPGNRRCWPRQGRVMALDAASGKVLWQRMDLRGHGLFARMLLDQNPDGTLLILDSNEVLNAATGVTLISRCAFPLDINMTPPAIAGDTAYIHGGGVAVRFQRDAEGRVGSQVLWSCPREQLARFYNFNTGGIQPVPAVLDEVLLMAKGNYDFHVAGPVADNFLYVFDRRSGVTVHRRCEYLLNGLNTAPALLVAGGRLYVADGGCRFKLAYTVSGESTAPRVAVFTAQDPPALLAICPGLSDVVPVADGPSLFLAGRGRLACIERPAEKRERLAPVELRNMALHFLNQEIPPTPQNATKPHILQPLARLPADIPLSLVTELMPGIFPPRILGAYPLPYDPAITDPSTKISGAVMGLPHLGSRLQFSVDQAIPFRLLDAENVRFNYSDKASTGNVFFPGSSYCLTANGLSSSPGLLQAAFFTVYYTPRLQTLSYRSSRGLRLWLSGKEIMNDDLLQLEPGYYPCFFTTRLRMPIKIMEKVRFLPCFQVEDNPAALWRTWANTVRKFRGHLETMVRDGAGLRESIGAQVILESLSIER